MITNYYLVSLLAAGKKTIIMGLEKCASETFTAKDKVM